MNNHPLQPPPSGTQPIPQFLLADHHHYHVLVLVQALHPVTTDKKLPLTHTDSHSLSHT